MATKRKSAKAAPVTAEALPSVTSIKGFDKDLSCRGFKFEVGKTYEHTGKVEACEGGFHACPVDQHPLSVFEFYGPAGNRFALVTQSGERSAQGTKLASAKITIDVELSLGDLVKRTWDFVWSRAKLEAGTQATGYQGAASATGYQGAASATGDYGAASATGDYGAASATGDYGAASATGGRGAASATGDYGAASATGDYGAASATGYQGAASATGYQGAASATGGRGAASATGDYGAASATGDYGAASAKGKFSGAYATGFGGKVSGVEGSALHLDERVYNYGHPDHGKIVAVWAGIVGQNGIKPGVFYTLRDGKPVEAAP